MNNQRQLFTQVALFLVVGIITLCIDVSVTSALYYYLNTPAYLASALGFTAGFFFNFPINRKKVFHHSEKDKYSLHAQIIMFLSLSTFNLFATSFLVEFLVSSQNVHIQYAKLLVTVLIAIWNFCIFKLLIFSKNKS